MRMCGLFRSTGLRGTFCSAMMVSTHFMRVEAHIPSEFAFYVNKNGWRARPKWAIVWEGSPTAFGASSRKDLLQVLTLLQRYIIPTSWHLNLPLSKCGMSSLGTSCKSSPAPMFAACLQTPLHQSFKRPSAPLFTIHLFPNSERRMANPKCTLPTAAASKLRCRRGSRQDMVCQCIHHHFVQRILGSRSFSYRKKATSRCSSCNHLATLRFRL